MFKYKKITIYSSTILYIFFSIIELIKYLKCNSTLYGVFYLIINLFIIFLLVPCTYNYKKYYSIARISKLIIIVALGLFNSFILEHILINSMSYMDSSKEYIDSIFIYKDILKVIIYFILMCFTIFEFKVEKVINKNISKKELD